ncbi:hypothetical protein EVJ32_10880 [Exiguobacterium sp. SH5S4]|uniref:hypothetical protein n=1 Tax=Exiguobacterium sp. SH5S4 TaxID=2510961 RepID=UPI00103EE6AE|nr:hypothetical protein [Exiguobacterium sp. SH5S4]TCI25295.1 hypothetical protein EVJ32_10880 [Exiguobacterium sp. SH5S4]
MKITELQNITGKRYSTRKKQLELIQGMADQATVRTGVYGKVVVEERNEHMVFHFENEHYGKIEAVFNTVEELEQIKSGVYMAYHEAENIHYRLSFTPTNVTEMKIKDANSLFETLTEGNKPTYTTILNRIENVRGEQRWYITDLLEVHAYINKKAFEYAYAQHVLSMKNFDTLKEARA